ncbi:hypothetical protein ACFL40_02930, partial [candidate division KSB1 bacterium]
ACLPSFSGDPAFVVALAAVRLSASGGFIPPLVGAWHKAPFPLFETESRYRAEECCIINPP